MIKLAAIPLTALLLLFTTDAPSNRFSKYKAVEAYEIRPSILMTPSYTAEGEVCEIGIETKHYSPEIIHVGSALLEREVKSIVDELAPPDERGPESVQRPMGGFAGGTSFMVTSYQNLEVAEYRSILHTDAKMKNIQVSETESVTIKWKNRKCK